MKNQKVNITQYVAEKDGLATDPKSLRKYTAAWWQNPRSKEVGGLKLTEEGFARLTRHFKAHQVRFENKMELDFTNQQILHLEKFITCPWYITKKEMFVFDDKMAVQLVLFSGDIMKFTTAKARSQKTH